MKAWLVCSALALVDCATVRKVQIEPDYRTEGGAAVFLNGHDKFLPKEVADELEFKLITSVTDGYDRAAVMECVERSTIRVVDFPAPAPCPSSGKPAGCQDNNTIYVSDIGCPYQSAYIHESLHWVQQCALHVDDYEHKRSEWSRVDAARHDCAEAKTP